MGVESFPKMFPSLGMVFINITLSILSSFLPGEAERHSQLLHLWRINWAFSAEGCPSFSWELPANFLGHPSILWKEAHQFTAVCNHVGGCSSEIQHSEADLLVCVAVYSNLTSTKNKLIFLNSICLPLFYLCICSEPNCGRGIYCSLSPKDAQPFLHGPGTLKNETEKWNGRPSIYMWTGFGTGLGLGGVFWTCIFLFWDVYGVRFLIAGTKEEMLNLGEHCILTLVYENRWGQPHPQANDWVFLDTGV